MFQKGFSTSLSAYFVALFGIIGFLAPPFSLVVATFNGKTSISLFNSTMIMVLSVLVIVFLVIKAFDLFFARKKGLFVLDFVLLVLSIFSFLIHLLAFIRL